MVCVQFPEFAIKHIEVLIREVVSDFVYVLLSINVEKGVKKVRVLEVAVIDSTVIVAVEHVENTEDHRLH